MAMHIKFRVFWLVRAVVFSTLLLYNSMIGMFFIIIMINKQCCEYGHHFVYCHELSPLVYCHALDPNIIN